MSFLSKKIDIKLVLVLVILNVVILLLGFTSKDLQKSIETQKLIVRDETGSSYLELKMLNHQPYISLYNDKGAATMEMIGGNFPSINLRNNLGKTTAKIASLKEGMAEISLLDDKGNTRIELQGGNKPAIYMKDNLKRTIASLTILADGGTGLGLAHKNGAASAILRGGASPGIAFFATNEDPSAALGVLQGVPHLLVKGQEQMESILIHGGKPIGFLVMDEMGKPKIMISKHGVFQGKEEEPPQENEKSKYNFFSWGEDQSLLFPDAKDKSS